MGSHAFFTAVLLSLCCQAVLMVTGELSAAGWTLTELHTHTTHEEEPTCLLTQLVTLSLVQILYKPAQVEPSWLTVQYVRWEVEA